MLRAMRRGDVDALVVEADGTLQVSALETLAAASNRLRGEMLAQVSDAVIAVDADDRVSYLNSAAEQRYGVTAAQVLGGLWGDVYETQWDSDDARDAVLIAIRDHDRWHGEMRHLTRDGREVIVHASITRLRDSSKQPAGQVAILRDITDRKRAEQALHDSEAFSARVFEASPDCVKIIDSEGRLERMNLNGQHCLEIDDFATVYGAPWLSLWPVESHPMISAAIADARSGKVGRFSGFCPTVKGTPKWWDVMVSALPGADGVAQRLVASSRDVTREKATQQALQISEARYRSVFDNAATGFVIQDEAGKITEVNAAFATLLGYREDELKGVAFESLIHPDDRETDLASDERIKLKEATFYEIEDRCLHKDGHSVFVRKFVSALPSADGERKYFALMTDISPRVRAVAALKESDALQRLAAEAGGIGIWMWEPETDHVVWANPWWYEMLGIDRSVTRISAEIFANEFVHPDDLAAFATAFMGDVTAKSTFFFEGRLRRRDGSLRWVELKGKARPAERGMPMRILGTARDITDRKDRETALRESESQLRMSLEAATAGIWRWDIRTDEMFWSPENFILHGLDHNSDAPFYKDLDLLIHPDDRQSVRNNVDDAVEGRTEEFRAEYRVKGVDGAFRWLLGIGKVERGPNNAPLSMSGINLDITERKTAEAAIQERLDEIEALYVNAPIGLALFDRELRIVRINEALAKINGAPAADHIGRFAWDVVPALREKVEPKLRHVLDTAELVEAEISGETPKMPGITRHWQEKYYPLKNKAGEVIAVGATIEEITLQKQREESIHILLREVNHRSKNLLTLVQAVAKQTAATRPEDFLERFGNRVQSLSASQDLLISGDWRPVPLADLVRSQLAHFRDLSGVRVTATGPTVLVSPAAAQTLGMALHELATNAAKYGALSNADGRVAIAWSVAHDANENRRFHLSWIESGGPPITNPGKRGFGSRLIDTIVRMGFNCDVDLQFAPTGLAWRMAADAHRVLEGVPPPPVSPAHASDPANLASLNGRRRVLVVEDEPIIAMEVASMLTDAGFDVVGPAHSVGQAMDALNRFGCDAAVLDSNLGTETAELIAVALSASQTPYIIVSGYARDQQPDGLKHAPLLTKPLLAGALVKELEKCFPTA